MMEASRAALIGGLSLAAFLNCGGVALAQSPPPVNLHMGAGVALTNGKTVYSGGTGTLTAGGTATLPPLGTGLAIISGTLVPTWRNLNTVTALDTLFFTINAGTLTSKAFQGPALLGNASGTIGQYASITIGAGLTITATGTTDAGTIAATGTGTVTNIVAGNGLSGGTITNTGTVSSIGTLALTGTAAGTLTVNPASGVSDVKEAMPAAGGTVTANCAPAFAGQRWTESLKQGATASVYVDGANYIFGAAPSSYTITATPNLIDRRAIFSPDGTHCAIMAIDQGFSF